MARHHKKPKSTRTQFDINRIKQDLTILDALDGLGVAFTSHGDKRISCPIHNGDDGSFSIFDGDDGQRWRCHSQCQTSGDVIDLIEAIEKLEPGAAIRRAAELLGIEPTVEVDPFLAIAREATRGAKRVADAARRAEAEQLRASANVRDATELWIKLTREGYVGPNMFDAPIAPRSRVCADYLRNRKLDGAINATRWLVLAAAEDGSPVVPIYTIARDVCPYLDNGVINCVTRHLSGAKLGLTGHTTKGTYGRSAALVGMDATDARPVRLVLVEGLTDYLGGLALFSGRANRPPHVALGGRYPGLSTVLGAQSIGLVPYVIDALGADDEIGPVLRSIEVVYVEQDDRAKSGAAQKARPAINEAAKRHGITLCPFDLDGADDLADYCARRIA